MDRPLFAEGLAEELRICVLNETHDFAVSDGPDMSERNVHGSFGCLASVSPEAHDLLIPGVEDLFRMRNEPLDVLADWTEDVGEDRLSARESPSIGHSLCFVPLGLREQARHCVHVPRPKASYALFTRSTFCSLMRGSKRGEG